MRQLISYVAKHCSPHQARYSTVSSTPCNVAMLYNIVTVCGRFPATNVLEHVQQVWVAITCGKDLGAVFACQGGCNFQWHQTLSCRAVLT